MAGVVGQSITKIPVMVVLRGDPFPRGWFLASHILGSVAGIVIVAAGIGLLGLKPWARTASIVYAVYAIVATTVGTILNLTVVLPRVAELAPGLMGGMVGVSCGSVIYLVYPILLLIFMTRPNVVAAFRK